jgi:predicted alpha-1,6-mannanase (GH76 family)
MRRGNINLNLKSQATFAAELNRHRDFVNQNVLKRLEQLEKNVDWISKELERHKNFINDRLVRR